MTAGEIAEQLEERLGSVEDVSWPSRQLVDQWIANDVGFEAVEPILRFMENHPDADLGSPGALVQFSEQFYGHSYGYEEKLLESISRRPVFHTIWMLNRLINGVKVPATRQGYVDAMIRAKSHPLVDPHTLNWINDFLERLERLGIIET